MVPMIDIEELLPEVAIYAPSVPEPLAVRHIRDVAREMCFRGRMWRDTDEIAVSEPESEGVCTLPDAAIVEIESARLGEYVLEPKSVGWLDDNVPRWDQADVDCGSPRYITQLNPNTVTIVPKATGTLIVRLILQPSRAAQQVPQFLKDDHGPTVAMGAASRILLTPEQSYTNPQLAAHFGKQFEGEIGTLTIMAAKGQQGSRVRVRPHYL